MANSPVAGSTFLETLRAKTPDRLGINWPGRLPLAAGPVRKPDNLNPHYTMLQWTEQFATGSTNLDFQHQTLIDNLNELEKLLAIASPTRADREFIVHTVGFLEGYADKHFKCEEQCMEFFRCPTHAKNKQAHLDFMTFFQEFKQHHRSQGFPREIVVTLHSTIHQWITDHILHVDTQLRPFIKG